MILSPQFSINYAEFVDMVKAVGGIRAVYYFDDTANGSFRITVVAADGEVGVYQSIPMMTPPATFAADFPDAVSFPGYIGVS